MSEHDDLERMLMKVSERRIEALERELDRKLSRLWRVHASQLFNREGGPLQRTVWSEGSSRSRWRSLALRQSS
jgi:hypothetical protein